MRRHRSTAEFHLACPYTSLPVCRCRLYIHAEPVRCPQAPRISSSSSGQGDARAEVEAVRQNLLGAIMKGGNTRRETHSYLSPSFVRAVHRRSLGISAPPCDGNNESDTGLNRIMAALVDSAEITREDSQVRANLVAAEIAEKRRAEEEERRMREEALRLAAEPKRKQEEEEEQMENEIEIEQKTKIAPSPVAQAVRRPSGNSSSSRNREKLSHLSAEEEAHQEELKEIEREKARIRKRERDRERRRLKKLQREKDLEAKRKKNSSRKR